MRYGAPFLVLLRSFKCVSVFASSHGLLAGQVEEFHVMCIEEWRRAMGLEKITLLGHSFGGYMSACYALR